MAEYRNSDGFQKTYTTKDAVISSGQSLSGVIDLEQLNITGLLIPSSWTTAKITFQVSPDGTTFGDLNDASGNEIQLSVAAGKFIGVNLAELSGARFIKLRSGTSGSPVNQGADRTITIVLTSNAEASAGGNGGGAATIADGADVAEGATTDAAVASGAAGTISAKLRRISADLATLLTQTDGIEGSLVSIDGKTAAGVSNGQATMANSKPVVIASDQSTVPTKGNFTEQTSLSAGSLNADLVASTDVSAYKWFSLQILGTFTGTLTFQGSNDNSNWVSIPVNDLASNVMSTTKTTTGIVHAPIAFRYLRIRMTSYTSGTATGVLQLYTSPASLLGVTPNSATGSGVPANAFYIGVRDTNSNLQPLYNDSVGDAQPGLVVAPRLKNGELQRAPTTFKTFSGTVITSETTIWTPAAGKKFRLMGYVITQTATTGDITVRDNTAGTTILVIPAHTLGVVQVSPNLGNGKLSAATNNVLTMQGASGETISGYVFGTEE